jgi:addiction module RelE/StbE family toxin
MKLRYTPQARRHLNHIAEYIAERNPRAAVVVGKRIRAVIELLCDFPFMGHEGLVRGTREMVVPGLPYIIVYRIEQNEENGLTVLGVYHGAQDRSQ